MIYSCRAGSCRGNLGPLQVVDLVPADAPALDGRGHRVAPGVEAQGGCAGDEAGDARTQPDEREQRRRDACEQAPGREEEDGDEDEQHARDEGGHRASARAGQHELLVSVGVLFTGAPYDTTGAEPGSRRPAAFEG